MINKNSLFLVIFLVIASNYVESKMKNLKVAMKNDTAPATEEAADPYGYPAHCDDVYMKSELSMEEMFDELTNCQDKYCNENAETGFCVEIAEVAEAVDDDPYGYPDHCDDVYNQDLTMNEMFKELVACQDLHCAEKPHKGFCIELYGEPTKEDKKKAEEDKAKEEEAKKKAEEDLKGPEEGPQCMVGDEACMDEFCGKHPENDFCLKRAAIKEEEKRYAYPDHCDKEKDYGQCVTFYCDVNVDTGFCQETKAYGYPYHCNNEDDYSGCLITYCSDEANKEKGFCGEIDSYVM